VPRECSSGRSELCALRWARRIALILVIGGCAIAAPHPPPQVDLPTLPAALPTGVTLDAKTYTYRIVGTDRRSVTASLRAGSLVDGVQRFSGYHHWNVRWHWHGRKTATQCVMDSVSVVIASQIVLPAWDPLPGVDAELQAQWRTYSAALATHERGHRSVTTLGAIRMQEGLMQLSAPQCDQLAKKFDEEAHRYAARIQADNDRYDAETNHGTTQGARWPPAPMRLPHRPPNGHS